MTGDPYKIPTYRVEWRATLTTNWILIGTGETHDEATGLMEHWAEQGEGQTRIVTQHAIMAKGLGA